jgi:hypothetical protein
VSYGHLVSSEGYAALEKELDLATKAARSFHIERDKLEKENAGLRASHNKDIIELTQNAVRVCGNLREERDTARADAKSWEGHANNFARQVCDLQSALRAALADHTRGT